MGKKLKGLLLTLVLCLQVVVPAANADAATVLYNNATGKEGKFDYELWKDNGSTSMTLKGDGLFECWWENIGNALFRKGIKWDCTQTYSQLGNITVNYGVDYQPNGNSYLCVYGWCRNPLVEYYIVESWGTWRPPGATSKGTITVDGGTYDVYETTRVNQPSIDGNTTFQQYWSVRTSKRTSGTISVTEHFKAWERMGMQMGKMYEAALTVEGYQSSGWADVYKFDITVGGGSSGSNNNNNNNNWNNNTGNNNQNNNNNTGAVTGGSSFTIEAEKFNDMSGVEVAGNCVGYIDPGDWMSYNVNVQTAGTYTVDFSLASANGSSFKLNNTTVDVPNTGDWSAYKTVTKEIYLNAGLNTLKITTDRGAFNIDKMVFNLKSGSNNNNNNNNNNNWGNNNNNNTGNTGNTGTVTGGSTFTIEAEKYNSMSGVEVAGGVIGYIDPGDWMSYNVNVQTAGTYKVDFSLASANGSSFKLNDTTVDVPNTGDWGVYKTVTKEIYLSAGNNTLKITTDRGAFNIDKMVFTLKSGSSNNTTNNNNSNNNNWNNNTNNNQSSNTGNSGSASFTIEAEKFDWMSGVEAAGGCVGYIDPGDWMSYNINVSKAGTYTVQCRVASALGSSFRFEKNSGRDRLATVTVPNTGDWGAYTTVTTQVYLTAGNYDLSIATDQGGFNIDNMVFTLK